MVHSADSKESAKRELAFWFKGDQDIDGDHDIFEWEPALKDWTTERDEGRERPAKNRNSAGGHGNGISEEDVKRAEQAVADAERAVNSLNKADISQLKAYHSPPAVVEDVASAVQILLANSGRISREKRSWKNFQIMMSDPSSFMRSLNNFDKQAINAETFIALKVLDETVNAEGRHKSFDPDYVRKVSAGAAALATWVINMVTFYELIVEPRSKANSNRHRDERRERRERAAVLP